jgi:hypothetical protein
VGEKVGGEGALEGAGMGVAGQGGKVEVAEEHRYSPIYRGRALLKIMMTGRDVTYAM